jgi:hypothetical protein
MPFSTLAEDQMLDSLNASFTSGGTYTPIVAYASLHTAYSATGTSEVSGGSYARVAVTWSAASGSSKASASVASAINVPASTTVLYVGLWSAVSGGNFAGMGPIGGAAQYAHTAATSGNTFTAPGSSYANTNTVVLLPSPGSTTPGGFTIGTVYYVVSAAGATFSLSATSGGGAITVSAAGSGIVQAITPEVFGSAGTFTLSSETLSLV